MDAELERMAREAGLVNVFSANREALERFALLVEQRAMERAAVICDDFAKGFVQMITVSDSGYLDPRRRDYKAEQWFKQGAVDCAAAIRSSAPRGGKERV